MFWPIQRNKKRSNKQRRASGRRLLVETLEPRQVLSGIVDVSLTGGTLLLLGDQPLNPGGSNNPSDNWVEVSQEVNGQGAAIAGKFTITGKDNTLLRVDGSLMESVTYNSVMSIDVQLGYNNDTFELSGATAAGPEAGAKLGAALVRGFVDITNDACGVKKNILTNVIIKYDLDVERVQDTFGRSVLEIYDSTIEGAVRVENADQNQDYGGSSYTKLHRVHIERQLTIWNGYDLDWIDIQDCDIDMSTAAGTFISNGPGGSRTTFTSTGGYGNTLYGPLKIDNGENPIDVVDLQQLDDLVTFHLTDVRGQTVIVNGDGDTRVLLDENTKIGSNFNFLTLNNINWQASMHLENGLGVDLFDMKDSTISFGLVIDHDVPPEASGHWYGSTTTIYNSSIGNCLPTSQGIFVLGDDGADIFELTESVVDGNVVLKLFDGNNIVRLFENAPIQGLTIWTGAQIDQVFIKGTSALNRQVVMLAQIQLGDSNDLLDLEHVQFIGNTVLDGDLVNNLANQDRLLELDTIFGGGTVNKINWEVFV
jgi:hypothetical protein